MRGRTLARNRGMRLGVKWPKRGTGGEIRVRGGPLIGNLSLGLTSPLKPAS